MRTVLSPLCFGALAAVLLLAGCGRSGQVASPPPAPLDQVDIGGITYKISGPYGHENMAVFLLHGKNTDEQDYITLDQGLKDGVVKVSEKEEGAQVQQLTLENNSDKPLFLQEGDRIIGGQQDRTLVTSLVVPPKSGKMPVPTMCIEAGRWTAGQRGQVFEATHNAAYAPKEVRQAAKISKDQGQVWNEVAEKKKQAEKVLMASNTNSSLTEAFDSEQVKKISDAFADALKGCLADNQDAVGVAVVVNGKIEELNIYPNHGLLSRVYPRLIQSYAFQATVEKDKAKDATPCTMAQLTEFVTNCKERQAMPAEQINADNRLRITHFEGMKAACTTEYQGKPVHQQIISGTPQPGQPSQPRGQQSEDNRQQGAQAPNPPPQPAPIK